MTDIFSADQPAQNPQPAADQPQVVDHNSAFADQLAAITNEEGKPKYNSVEEALKGAANAQEYIRKLQADLDAANAERNKGAALDQVMDAIKNQQDNAADQQAASLGEEDVSVLFQKLLQKSKEDETRASNEQTFSEKVVAQYGDKSKEFIASKAKELGISTEMLREMSQKSPVAALTLLGVTNKESNQNSPRGTLNTTTLATNQPVPERTFSMGMSTNKELVNEWNRCKALVNSRN